MSAWLTQAEADALLAMDKHRIDDTTWAFPGLGEGIAVPLISADESEHFFLDITRGRINLAKGTFQNRARGVIILARLDFGGPGHRNPDGVEVPSPHLHLYREGYGDRWAIPLSPADFPDLADHLVALGYFMRYCKVIKPPLFEKGLF